MSISFGIGSGVVQSSNRGSGAVPWSASLPPQWDSSVGVQLPGVWRLTREEAEVDTDGFREWRFWEKRPGLDGVGPGSSAPDREHLTRPRIGAFDPRPIHVLPGGKVDEF